MRGIVVAVAFTFSLSALAGCLAGDKGDGPSARDITLPFEREDRANNTTLGFPVRDLGVVEVPTWKVGDYWEIATATLHAPSTVWTNYTAVVVSATDGYLLAAGDNHTSYLDALLVDMLPLGAVDASLQPAWRGGAFPMFRWPLADGASWSADVTLGEGTVSLAFAVGFDANVETPYGLRPGFRVSAVENGTLLFAYTYVPAAGWFTIFEEYNDEGNRIRWSTVIGWGSSWSEPAYGIAAEPLGENRLSFPRGGAASTEFAVPGGETYLFFSVHGFQRGVLWDQRATLAGPDNAIKAQASRTSGSGFRDNDWFVWAKVATMEGPWKIVADNIGVGDLDVTVHGVTDIVYQL